MADDRRASEALSSPPEPIGGEAELIEVMAQAICDEEWNGSQPAFDRKPASFGERYRGYARAALAAQRRVSGNAEAPQPPSTPEGEAVRVAIAALERVEEDLVGIVGIGARQNVNRGASLMYEQAQASRDEVRKALLSVSSHLELIGAPQLTPGIARAHADMWLEMKKRAEAAETEVARLGAALAALRRSGEEV